MLASQLTRLGRDIGSALRRRGETVAVAEGAAGGLISAAVLSQEGASAYFVGSSVIYTPSATRAFLRGAIEAPPGLRGATEAFAAYLAESVATRLGTTWGIGEGGAAGPGANPYGDPPGHAWVAVWGPTPATRHVLTGSPDRVENMSAFAAAALTLFGEQLA